MRPEDRKPELLIVDDGAAWRQLWQPSGAMCRRSVVRLHEEFKRRVKTQTVLPSADTAAMLFWALLASGQIIMRKVDGWQTLSQKPSAQLVDVAA
jgi:hypothetical protein